MTKTALRRIEFIVLIVIVVSYGLAAYQRNLIWKDNLSLWSDIVEKSPGKARGYNYLGLAYHEKGRPDEAIEQYKKGLSVRPFYSNIHNNIGISYFDKGLVDKAIFHFKHAIEINPSHADAHYNLGVAYGEKGLLDQAYSEMRKSNELRKR